MSIAISTSIDTGDFDKVVSRTREVLKDNGFGVLTEIDVQATLKEKLGESMERYLILGACNPTLAHRPCRRTSRSDCCCRAMSWSEKMRRTGNRAHRGDEPRFDGAGRRRCGFIAGRRPSDTATTGRNQHTRRGPAVTSIDLYVDPVCPFSWVTSRWLLDAAAATGRSVALRQMSLAVLNDGRDVEPAQRAKLEWSRRVGRVLAAATDEGGPGIRRSLRVAGRRGVQRGRDVADSSVKEALAATSCSPALVDALDDPAWDDIVRAAHQRSQDALGGSGGSPIIAVDGRGFFGPVLTALPTRDAGIALLDAVLTAVSTPAFAVLQRPYQGPPSTAGMGAADVPCRSVPHLRFGDVVGLRSAHRRSEGPDTARPVV
ncbi:hypothetical protein I553_7866 [Mycobacterium xenopi 4042]|uniref:DUF302 domain-containing protein n=1 Tax=Mycobacterium xenopi 4042 TaxID=1299334 RepID=X8ARM4_MYCXE|nr:hypothetical protein I553_7866 [Mycobacterium xenopi 4042]